MMVSLPQHREVSKGRRDDSDSHPCIILTTVNNSINIVADPPSHLFQQVPRTSLMGKWPTSNGQEPHTKYSSKEQYNG